MVGHSNGEGVALDNYQEVLLLKQWQENGYDEEKDEGGKSSDFSIPGGGSMCQTHSTPPLLTCMRSAGPALQCMVWAFNTVMLLSHLTNYYDLANLSILVHHPNTLGRSRMHLTILQISARGKINNSTQCPLMQVNALRLNYDNN